MSEIKWIKITTNVFDDEKIKIIDTLPARDEILVIWFKLLTLAGKVNKNGLLFMSDKIAYTPEMLAAIFNRELNAIKLALTTFTEFGMIEVENNEIISIANWEKHQNIDGMDKIREQTRLRVANHREKRKLIACIVTSNDTVTESNATEEELELELELELDKNKEEPFVSKFTSESDTWKLTKLLIDRISNNNQYAKIPTTPKKLEDWMLYVDKMIRLDCIDPQVIANVIDWCQNDEFWSSNILSAAKLRKQFPKLYAKYSSIPKGKTNDFRKKVQLMEDW